MSRFGRLSSLFMVALLSASCDQLMPRSGQKTDGDSGAGASAQPAAAGPKGRPSGSSAGASAGSSAARAERSAPPVLPEGTTIPVVLETGLSTATNNAGDLVVARVSQDVSVGGRVVVPADSEVRGRVTTSVRSGKVKGRGRLAVSFDRVVVRGQEHPVEMQPIDVTAKSGKKKDGALIAGGAGAGAIIGAIADGGHGAGVGALVGAGAGTGAALLTRGEDVKFPSGGKWNLKVARQATLG
jgi:hypothetical protein